MLKSFLIVAAFLAGAAHAANIQLPGGGLTVPGTSGSGVSFIYNGTLTSSDTIAFTQTGNPCLQPASTYCTNGAGVITVAGTSGVGQSTGFSGPVGIIPAGSWTFGALLMQVSGVGTVQVFPANAANGLGSGTPPTNLTLPATSLSSLGFGSFAAQTNPTITFIVADTVFTDNSGLFQLTQPTPPVPTLGEWALAALAAMMAAAALVALRRRRMA